MINFFTSIPLYPGWLFPFFFGLFFIKITKHPKLEKAIIIIIFFIPTLYAFVGFILMIIILFAFATADGDDYWAEGGMPLPNSSSMESTE